MESGVRRVLGGDPGRSFTDVLVRVERNGRIEDSYWRYSLTPVRDDAGLVRGVFVLSSETTAHVLATRRQASLDLLRRHLTPAATDTAVAQAFLLTVESNRPDLGGAALLARAGTSESVAALAGASHLHRSSRELGIDTDLAFDFALSPSLPCDDAYRLFLEQCALQVATAQHRIDSEALRQIVEAERDRLLLDAPVGAAVMIGDELEYRLVNSLYAMVSGRAAEAMVGKPFTTVFPELDGSPVHRTFMEVYRAGVPYVADQPTLVQIHRHGGALDDRYFTFNLSPLRSLDGQVYGLMVIAVDITVQVEAKAEVEELNVELRAAARAKDEFLALLGHELRNPLAPIVAALELMRMRDSATSREQVIIRRQVNHLTRLVDDLLDVSRITRGKVELRKEDVDAREVLLRAVEMVAPLIEQKQQHLHTDIASAKWFGDPARLAQIVSNLLTNASRYSPAGARITVLGRDLGGIFEITVADDGMGIPEHILDRISSRSCRVSVP